MNRLCPLLVLVPFLASCMVPLGYTSARAQGYVSDSPSAQYLQLSLDLWKKGLEVQATTPTADLPAALAELTTQFQQKVDQLSRGALEGDEIPVGDDTAVPRRSRAGVALAESLDRMARGLALADFDLTDEYQKVLGAEGAPRGLYLNNQTVWPNGTVYYRWASAGNPSPDHRRALADAMAEWSRASQGTVRFEELGSDSWTEFQLSIGLVGCVVFSDQWLEPGVAGKATIGYQVGATGYLKIDPRVDPGPGLRRVCLHELGHVLGLLHEHKRPDRDRWIDVASGGYSLGESDLGKVDEFVQNLRWRPVQITVGPWSVVVACPVWWKERNAVTVGPFDLQSVMIYSGFLTRQPWVAPDGAVWPPGSVVPWNTELSPRDRATVRQLYQ